MLKRAGHSARSGPRIGTDRYCDGEVNLRCRARDHSCLNLIVPHYDTMYQTLSL